MKETFKSLFNPVTLPNGVTLTNRIALAPMLVSGSNEDGTVGQEDLDYFGIRNNVGQLIITGAASVSKGVYSLDRQLGIFDDAHVAGLKELASLIKERGNKAIVQLHHAGRHSLGPVLVAPSEMSFPFLSEIPKELSEDEVDTIIQEFSEATRRAIEAGFDGVEIHGANHYLLQQFFSAYSNHRTDNWGGSFEKRFNFPLAVVNAIQAVVEESGKDDFIVGYRISPEEVHGDTIGYVAEEALQLIEKVVEKGIDYIHLSLFSNYDATPTAGSLSQPIGKLVQEHVAGRCPVVVVNNIWTAEDALDALQYGDIVALGRGALIEPEWVDKVERGEEDTIRTEIEDLESLKMPKGILELFVSEHNPLPPLPGIEKVKAKLLQK